MPGLAAADPSRLSKHAVVEESITHHRLQQSRFLEAIRQVESLTRERDELLAEVNGWRELCGEGAPTMPTQSTGSNGPPPSNIPPQYAIDEPVPRNLVSVSPKSTPTAQGPAQAVPPLSAEVHSRATPPWPEIESHEHLPRLDSENNTGPQNFWDDSWFRISLEPDSIPAPEVLGPRSINLSAAAQPSGPAMASVIPPHLAADKLSFADAAHGFMTPDSAAFPRYLVSTGGNGSSAAYPTSLDNLYNKT